MESIRTASDERAGIGDRAGEVEHPFEVHSLHNHSLQNISVAKPNELVPLSLPKVCLIFTRPHHSCKSWIL